MQRKYYVSNTKVDNSLSLPELLLQGGMFELPWQDQSSSSEFKNISLSLLLPYLVTSTKLKQYRALQIANDTKLKNSLYLCHKEPECLGYLIVICLQSNAPKQCGIFQISKSLIRFFQSCGVVRVFIKSVIDSDIALHTTSIILFTVDYPNFLLITDWLLWIITS